jgi:hypothetical protein
MIHRKQFTGNKSPKTFHQKNLRRPVRRRAIYRKPFTAETEQKVGQFFTEQVYR